MGIPVGFDLLFRWIFFFDKIIPVENNASEGDVLKLCFELIAHRIAWGKQASTDDLDEFVQAKAFPDDFPEVFFRHADSAKALVDEGGVFCVIEFPLWCEASRGFDGVGYFFVAGVDAHFFNSLLDDDPVGNETVNVLALEVTAHGGVVVRVAELEQLHGLLELACIRDHEEIDIGVQTCLGSELEGVVTHAAVFLLV